MEVMHTRKEMRVRQQSEHDNSAPCQTLFEKSNNDIEGNLVRVNFRYVNITHAKFNITNTIQLTELSIIQNNINRTRTKKETIKLPRPKNGR